MTLNCHDRRPLSSLAFGRGWKEQPKLFCVRRFAGQGIVVPFSGSAGIVIVDISTAVNAAGTRSAASRDVRLTCAINEALKENSTTGIGSVTIDAGGHKPA